VLDDAGAGDVIACAMAGAGEARRRCIGSGNLATFLIKGDPEDFGFEDLVREGRSRWDGVANPTALIHLRTIRTGDELLVFHTGGERAVVGLARAVSDAYADPKRPELNDRGEAKFAVVDAEPVARAATPVTLAALREQPAMKDFVLLKQSRLSVMPVPGAIDRAIRAQAGFVELGGKGPARAKK